MLHTERICLSTYMTSMAVTNKKMQSDDSERGWLARMQSEDSERGWLARMVSEDAER